MSDKNEELEHHPCVRNDSPKLYSISFAEEQMERAGEILRTEKLDPRFCMQPISVAVTGCNLVVSEDVLARINSDEAARAVPFQPPIQMVTCVPRLIRFIKKPFVQKFFETGELQLSSFDHCKRKENVGARADRGEGISTFVGLSKAGTAEIVVGVGGNPLMLCFALAKNARHDDDDCFVVEDFGMFLDSVTASILESGMRVRQILHGPCSYTDRLVVRRNVDSVASVVTEVQGSRRGFDFGKMVHLAHAIGGRNNYFAKPVGFSDESEYRIVWECDNTPSEGVLKVNVKDVEKFCSRLI